MFDVKVDCMVNIHIFFSYIGATQSWPSDEDYYRFPSVSGKSNRTSKVSTYKARLSWIFFLTMKHPNESKYTTQGVCPGFCLSGDILYGFYHGKSP